MRPKLATASIAALTNVACSSGYCWANAEPRLASTYTQLPLAIEAYIPLTPMRGVLLAVPRTLKVAKSTSVQSTISESAEAERMKVLAARRRRKEAACLKAILLDKAGEMRVVRVRCGE